MQIKSFLCMCAFDIWCFINIVREGRPRPLLSQFMSALRLCFCFSVSLPKPSISMSPVGEVTLGQGANITCSTSNQRLGGTFVLQQTSGAFRKTQTSSTNSAAFNLLQVDFGNEGSYTCQYRIRLSSRDFNSPLSDSVRLSVAGKTHPLNEIAS